MSETRSEQESKTLTDLIRAEIRQFLLKTRCTMPGTIVSFDGTRAKVQPGFKAVQAPGETAISLPKIVDVPVCFPVSSGASAYINFPVKAGDTGTIQFFDRDVSGWLNGDGKEKEPAATRIHDLTDAQFIPNMTPFSKAIGATDSIDIVNGSIGMSLIPTGEGKIKIENGTAELIALLVQTLTALETAVVPTMLGPQQLSTVLDGTITTIRTKLETFEG